MPCPHEHFDAHVKVGRLLRKEGDTHANRFCADITIKCLQCGEPFRFLGLPCGLDLEGASVSADGTEARLAIGTAEIVGNIIDGDCPIGFTVRRVQ